MPFSWRRYRQIILLALYYVRATQSMHQSLLEDTYESAEKMKDSLTDSKSATPGSATTIIIEPTITKSNGVAAVGDDNAIEKGEHMLYKSSVSSTHDPAAVDSLRNGVHVKAPSRDHLTLDNGPQDDGSRQDASRDVILKDDSAKEHAIATDSIKKDPTEKEKTAEKKKEKKGEKKKEKDEEYDDPSEEILPVDPVLGFMQSLKTVENNPALALRIHEMATDLETIRFWTQHAKKLIENKNALETLGSDIKLYKKEILTGKKLEEDGVKLLHKGWKIYTRSNFSKGGKIFPDPDDGVKVIPDGENANVIRDPEDAGKIIPENGERLISDSKDEIEVHPHQPMAGLKMLQDAEELIESGQKILRKGNHRMRLAEQDISKILKEKSTLIEPYKEFVEQLFLVNLGSRLEFIGKISPEESALLSKHIDSIPPATLDQGKEANGISKDLENNAVSSKDDSKYLSTIFFKKHPDEDNVKFYSQVHEKVENLIKIMRGGETDSDETHSKFNSDKKSIRQFYKAVSENLSKILHKIGPVEIEMGDNFDEKFYKKGLLLRKNIFDTINYMHKYGYITTEDYQEFFLKDNTLEIAAINIYYSLVSQNQHWISYHTNEYALLVRGLVPYASYIMQGYQS
ncbi:hypothetical protein PTTG_25426 [Puccinia triticina 1-1 BBBD Race 1]|uniref:Uncharacterized protein n=1 Tax=Puccinia triticina (isolate 1-1 / race 1 (BBBD)) TaxID=630390 RepID=A0A180H397_PUCT1|nr:hypothetical protein PTTG_25426 [Puccinia triticina 1-1 BBBD Race 1]